MVRVEPPQPGVIHVRGAELDFEFGKQFLRDRCEEGGRRGVRGPHPRVCRTQRRSVKAALK